MCVCGVCVCVRACEWACLTLLFWRFEPHTACCFQTGVGNLLTEKIWENRKKKSQPLTMRLQIPGYWIHFWHCKAQAKNNEIIRGNKHTQKNRNKILPMWYIENVCVHYWNGSVPASIKMHCYQWTYWRLYCYCWIDVIAFAIFVKHLSNYLVTYIL